MIEQNNFVKPKRRKTVEKDFNIPSFDSSKLDVFSESNTRTTSPEFKIKSNKIKHNRRSTLTIIDLEKNKNRT